MKNFKVYILVILLGSIFIQTAVSDSKESKPKKIRIGLVAGGIGKPVASGVMGVAAEKHFITDEFKNDGIIVELIPFKGTGPAINEALAANGLDFANYGDLPVLIGRSGGIKTKIIANGGRGSEIYIIGTKNSTLKSLQDLKGKKVATLKGTYMHLLFARIIAGLGWNEKDLPVINLSQADGLAAIASEKIDAYIGSLSVLALVHNGQARLIYTSAEPVANVPENWKGTGAIVVTEAFEKKYPALVTRVVKAILRAAKWSSDEANRQEYLTISARAGVPYEVYESEYENIPIAYFANPLLDDLFISHYQEIVAFSFKNALIRTNIDVEQWLEKKYLNEAVLELNLENFWNQSATNPLGTSLAKQRRNYE